MPLVGSDPSLTAALRTALIATGQIPVSQQGQPLTDFCDAIGTTVLAHLLANTAFIAALVAPPGGGPVTGTIQIT